MGELDGLPKTPQEDPRVLTEEERDSLKKLAQKIVDRKLTTPAILFLESMSPLHFVASQAMIGVTPFVGLVGGAQAWTRYAAILEKREAIQSLLREIEDADATLLKKEKEERKRHKEAKRNAKKQ